MTSWKPYHQKLQCCHPFVQFKQIQTSLSQSLIKSTNLQDHLTAFLEEEKWTHLTSARSKLFSFFSSSLFLEFMTLSIEFIKEIRDWQLMRIYSKFSRLDSKPQSLPGPLHLHDIPEEQSGHGWRTPSTSYLFKSWNEMKTIHRFPHQTDTNISVAAAASNARN